MAKYNVHGGHNSIVPGAAKYLNEVTEDRKVKNKIIELLKKEGHTVYDCTDDVGRTQQQNLSNIVAKCNKHSVTLDVSIHLNAGGGTGCEVFYYSGDSTGKSYASKISANISKALGIKNRGAKATTSLYVISNTKSTAVLVECCFVDSTTDKNKWNADKCAKAIVEGILGKTISSSTSSNPGPSSTSTISKLYRVRKSWSDAKSQIGAYANLDNAKAACKDGYTVYDWNGKAVYSKASTATTNLYRVRKSWNDVKSQLGAYAVLDNAKNNCPSGYNVYDWNGKVVYSNAPSKPADTNSKLYRVRKSWDDAKSQTGAYASLENAKNNCGFGYTVYDWNGKAVYTNNSTTQKPENNPETKPNDNTNTENKPSDDKPVVEVPAEDISPVKGLSHEAFIEYIGSLAKADMKKTGVLASVTIAQAILESAWGQSELSLKANNLFGMKASLSGNTWDSDWDGQIYAKRSNEEDEDGNVTSVLSDFRAYDTVEASIKDHSDYLTGAKNGSSLRYDGLKNEKDYRKAIQIIKDGGYATDSKYVDKVCNIIKENNLDVFDSEYDPIDITDITESLGEIKDILNKIFEFIQKIFK